MRGNNCWEGSLPWSEFCRLRVAGGGVVRRLKAASTLQWGKRVVRGISRLSSCKISSCRWRIATYSRPTPRHGVLRSAHEHYLWEELLAPLIRRWSGGGHRVLRPSWSLNQHGFAVAPIVTRHERHDPTIELY